MTPDHEETPSQAAGAARIVVGIDGSPASLDALGWAAGQAALTSASLEVVMTWGWPASYGWAMPIPSGFDPEVEVQKVLDQAKADTEANHPGVVIATRTVEGHPAPILVDASRGATLLVVGSRGHGEFVGMLIGSVSEFCATNAHCPVLVHRPVA
jgi:nucleotide-binding universal stress UspA family protein